MAISSVESRHSWYVAMIIQQYRSLIAAEWNQLHCTPVTELDHVGIYDES